MHDRYTISDSAGSRDWTGPEPRQVAETESGYEKQPPQLVTRWTEEVGPDDARPEYPRPQLVREEWATLNGVWQFAAAEAGESPPFGEELDERVLVPFPIESGLSGIKRHEPRMWYRRTFTAPDAWNVGRDGAERLLVHFERVDWEATVYVNGEEVGSHRGGYDHFTADVTDALTEEGPQELVVGVYDPTGAATEPVGHQPKGRQGVGYGVEGDGTLWLSSVSGIWGTVWLEPVPERSIAGLDLTPDPANETLELAVETAGGGDGGDDIGRSDLRIEATARADGTAVGSVSGPPGAPLSLPVPEPRTWSPADPFLYDLEVRLLEGDGTAVDEVESYVGMRSLGVREIDGVARPTLNGEVVYHVGSLESGYWPDGLYTAPSDDALRYNVAVQRELGFNMVRKHCKLETRRWFYHADRLGLLVWQDVPHVEETLPEMDHLPPVRDEASRENFRREVEQMVTKHDTHPSLAVWTAFNENWGVDNDNDYIREITALIADLDPERYVNPNSGYEVGGNVDSGAGDVKDVHQYPGPDAPEPEPDRFSANGEYSTASMQLPDHTWGECYGDADPETFVSEYVASVDRLADLATERGLSASVYTATTDLENVCNGHVTYDREVVKAALAEEGVERVRAAHESLLETAREIDED